MSRRSWQLLFSFGLVLLVVVVSWLSFHKHADLAGPVSLIPPLSTTLEVVSTMSLREPIVEKPMLDFDHFRSKVLLSADEKARLNEILSDGSQISSSHEILKSFGSADSDRIVAIDYLEKAVAWKQNPSRSLVLAVLKDILITDNLHKIADLDIRRSYAGDKIELYQLIKVHAPETLKEFEQLPNDSRIAKLILFSEGFFGRL
ncbi:MAG: hypothetical protein V4534_07430 [Myxococcota bacterium]